MQWKVKIQRDIKKNLLFAKDIIKNNFLVNTNATNKHIICRWKTQSSCRQTMLIFKFFNYLLCIYIPKIHTAIITCSTKQRFFEIGILYATDSLWKRKLEQSDDNIHEWQSDRFFYKWHTIIVIILYTVVFHLWQNRYIWYWRRLNIAETQSQMGVWVEELFDDETEWKKSRWLSGHAVQVQILSIVLWYATHAKIYPSTKEDST